MPARSEGRLDAEQRLKASLTRSLRGRPRLVSAEQILHGSIGYELEASMRTVLLSSLRGRPRLIAAEQMLHGSLGYELEASMRAALLSSFDAQPTLTVAERSILQSLGSERLGEVRSMVQVHLEGPTAIPDEDLAVYAPADERIGQRTRDFLIEQMEEISGLTAEELGPALESKSIIEATSVVPADRAEESVLDAPAPLEEELPIADAAVPAIDEPVSKDQETAVVMPVPPDEEFAEELIPEPDDAESSDLPAWTPDVDLKLEHLRPLPLVAAALEAIGLDETKYGFLLRYGSYAPQGRKSQILVDGLGLAEFSRRAAGWFDALGATKFPLQVVDEGSGELTVYVLESEPS